MRSPRASDYLRTLLALFVGTACGSSEPLPPAISVSMTLSRTSLRMNDTIMVDLVGTNITAEMIKIPNSACLVNLDARNEQDQSVSFIDPVVCDAIYLSPRVLAPGESWRQPVVVIHPPAGQFRVRGGLPSALGVEGYVYSDFTAVSVRP